MLFKFTTVSEQDIQNSRGGNDMLNAIRYDGPLDQLITGRPGSGKTTVTIMRARYLAAQGKVVLLLTKHNLLVYSLKNSDPTSKVNIYGVYDWFSEKFSGAWLSSFTTGEALREKLKTLNSYAEILIDEGQDLGEHFYEAIPLIARRLLIGADTAQRLYSNGADAQTIERALATQKREILPVELEYNYRNYVETYDFARQFVPDFNAANTALILENTTKGKGGQDYLPRVIQAANKFDELLNIVQDNSTSNIAIVLPHIADVIAYHKNLTFNGIACSMYHKDLSPTDRWTVANDMQNVLVTTYWSVKGLEFPIVIMPEMDYALTPADKLIPSHYYVSCTRATERLYLLYQGASLPSCLTKFRADSFQHIKLGDARQQVNPSPPKPPVNYEDFF